MALLTCHSRDVLHCFSRTAGSSRQSCCAAGIGAVGLGRLGFGIVAATPADDGCGVCHNLCLGGLAALTAPAMLPPGACHAFPCGGLAVTIGHWTLGRQGIAMGGGAFTAAAGAPNVAGDSSSCNYMVAGKRSSCSRSLRMCVGVAIVRIQPASVCTEAASSHPLPALSGCSLVWYCTRGTCVYVPAEVAAKTSRRKLRVGNAVGNTPQSQMSYMITIECYTFNFVKRAAVLGSWCTL